VKVDHDQRSASDSSVRTRTDVRVIDLSGDLVAEAASVLARSFHDNPNFVYLFPDERARALPRLQQMCLHDALGFGRVNAATLGGEIVGVAAWLPPHAFPLSPGDSCASCPT
jgi:hypothetical protein